MKFSEFKVGPARGIMRALGGEFAEVLGATSSYSFLRRKVVALNDEDRGCVAKAARRYAGVCSPGERELLKGILLLCDFAHIADEIADGEAYGNMTRCGGDFRQALAACVVNAGY